MILDGDVFFDSCDEPNGYGKLDEDTALKIEFLKEKLDLWVIPYLGDFFYQIPPRYIEEILEILFFLNIYDNHEVIEIDLYYTIHALLIKLSNIDANKSNKLSNLQIIFLNLKSYKDKPDILET